MNSTQIGNGLASQEVARQLEAIGALLRGDAGGLATSSPSGFITSCVASSPPIGTSSFTIAAANASRKDLIISNPTTYKVWLRRGAGATVGAGILLPAGGSVIFDGSYSGVVTGIGETGASGNLAVEEGS